MMVPGDRQYFKEHEWVMADDNTAAIGLTEYAQEQLGDVVFVDLPDVGTEVEAGEPCGEVESVKSVSSIFCPISGTVVKVNQKVVDEPELVNQEPYDDGWLFEVEIADPAEFDALMDASKYEEFIKE